MPVRISRKLVIATLFVAAVAAAADSSLVDLIMPDARVVVSINIARIRESPLLPAFSNGMHNANPELQKLMDAAGFDPLRDLQEILFATPGTGKNPPALVVARGTFDTARLRAFAELAGSKITEWQGVPILSDPDKDSGAFALLDNTILAGNLEQIKAAIGRRGHGLVLNTEMAMRVADLGRRYDAWLVSIAPLATMAANLPADAKMEGLGQLEMLRSIDQFSLGVSMSTNLTLAAEIVANNGKAAGALADGVQMLIAMAQKSAQDQPAAMSALKNMNFGVEGNVVHLGFTVPLDEVQQAVQNAVNMQTKPAQATATTAGAQPPVMQEAAVTEPVIAEPVVANPVVGKPAIEQPAIEPPVIAQAEVQQAVLEPVAQEPAPRPAPVKPKGPVTKSPKIPANAELLIQSSPKDMGTVVIMGSKK